MAHQKHWNGTALFPIETRKKYYILEGHLSLLPCNLLFTNEIILLHQIQIFPPSCFKKPHQNALFLHFRAVLPNIPSAADTLALLFLSCLLVSPQLIREPSFIFHDAGWKDRHKHKEIFLDCGLNTIKIV